MSTRPPVSVVVPYGGTPISFGADLQRLRVLKLAPGDELVLADNTVTGTLHDNTIRIVRAAGERSPAHARNVGAAAAVNEWILFLDADTLPPEDLIDRFFAEPIAADVGAVSGDIAGVVENPTLAARFGASRNFLSQANHLSNPYKPRAASANLLVRRAAFTSVNGFVEGVRAAEDTDFSWRLQDAGWTLGFRPDAVVGHRYRESLADLRRQWRGYAAGAAWLATRWPGYRPDPALNRFGRILLSKVGLGPGLWARAAVHAPAGRSKLSRSERLQFLMVQILLGIDEQIGLRQSNDANDSSA